MKLRTEVGSTWFDGALKERFDKMVEEAEVVTDHILRIAK